MLNTALKRAEDASKAKSEFLARMSHELRTPLNGIVGSVDLLATTQSFSAEGRVLLQTIRDSVDISLRQINNVLDFSKLESGKLSLERTDLDLHEVVNSAASMVRPAARQKNLRYFVRIAPDVPYRLVGDPHHLRTILLNLLSNAAKFTHQGQITLDVTGREEPDGKVRVRFEVRDTGIGISPDALETIFESFTQEDSSTTRRYGGSGLGTTIAKQLVEMMGGRIGVESVKGEGSLFWFEIPFDRQTRAADRFVEMLPGARALLLTEDTVLLEHYRRTVEGFQGQLVHVRSGQEAIQVLGRALRVGNPVYAVLVDAALAFNTQGENQYGDLCEKAIAANVGVYLITDSPPPAEKQRALGYSGTLGTRVEPTQLHAALRAAPARMDTPASTVVSLPPWVWQRRAGGGDRPRVLVADDNRTNLMIVQRMLEQGGYEVDAVETGDEALEKLCAGGYRAAVLDMHMPELDGITVLRRYRSLRPQSRLPIIVLTANATLEAQQASAEAGADAYLAKPVTSAELLGELERLVRETEVRVLAEHPAARREERSGTGAVKQTPIIDTEILAELDRLYDEPHQLARLIREYESEGRTLITQAAEACAARNYAAFCDALHALKGNAANVGAVRLARLCSEMEAAGMVEFIRERERMLVQLKDALAESVTALQDILRGAAAAESQGRAAKHKET
jgi:two-component system sensor histidine kinase RpfC